MALVRRGKHNYFHAYFRTLELRPDGTLVQRGTTVNLFTTDRKTAEALEAELMKKNRQIREHCRAKAHQIKMAVAAGERPVDDQIKPARIHRRRRLLIDQAITAAEAYRPVGESAAKHFRNFAKMIPCRYMDEVTPEIAFDYLCRRFPEGQGKSFSNCRGAINRIFKLTLLDAGIERSPFDLIPRREINSKHQRPFSNEEFAAIFEAAPEPWRSAAYIAWHTGLREKDVFTLRWDEIHADVIIKLPAKTSQFRREVQIPMHPVLMAYLDQLPRVDDRVLGAWAYSPKSSAWQQAFPRLLRKLNITGSDLGLVNFNSFRNSFITRCDAAGIPRHAIRLAVGQVEDKQTDVYSHDLTTARRIQKIDGVKLDKQGKIVKM